MDLTLELEEYNAAISCGTMGNSLASLHGGIPLPLEVNVDLLE